MFVLVVLDIVVEGGAGIGTELARLEPVLGASGRVKRDGLAVTGGPDALIELTGRRRCSIAIYLSNKLDLRITRLSETNSQILDYSTSTDDQQAITLLYGAATLSF